MTRRRWIADELSGDRAILLGKNAEHLTRVLRARVGQQFEIATPSGVMLGEIVEIGPARVTFATREMRRDVGGASTMSINLYLSVFKFDRFEWAIEKCTELGARSIVPVIASRTDIHLARAAGKRVDRWRRVAHEAAQQSRRDEIPNIPDPEPLGVIANLVSGTRIVLAESERARMLSDSVSNASELAIAIGPEGGWTESELALLRDKGWIAASLGPTILRAETAAIAALAIAHACSAKTSSSL